MKNKQLFDLCLSIASKIVDRYKIPGQEFYAIDCGGGSTNNTSTSTTNFARKGTTASAKEFALPAGLTSLINQNVTGNAIRPDVATVEQSLFSTLLSRDNTLVPGIESLQEAQGVQPTSFTGGEELSHMIARDPYSKDYEDATSDAYNRAFDKARASAISGPANVRGGTARQGFELADLDTQMSQNRFGQVRDQQNKDAGVVQNAIAMANQIESMRRGSKLQGQQQQMGSQAELTRESLGASDGLAKLRANNNQGLTNAIEALGKSTVTETSDLEGSGDQIQTSAGNSHQIGGGLSCCFIFLEALNGELPWYVRAGRDKYNTPNRRNGYVWMSTWLVPWMQRSKMVRLLVNTFMVKPFLIGGKAEFTEHQTIKTKYVRALMQPVCKPWFALWSFIGWLKGVK